MYQLLTIASDLFHLTDNAGVSNPVNHIITEFNLMCKQATEISGLETPT